MQRRYGDGTYSDTRLSLRKRVDEMIKETRQPINPVYITEANTKHILNNADTYRVYPKIGGMRANLILLMDPETTLPVIIMYHRRAGKMYSLNSMEFIHWPSGACVFDGILTKDPLEIWEYHIFETLMYDGMNLCEKRYRARLACGLCFVEQCSPSGNIEVLLQQFYRLGTMTKALGVDYSVEGLVFVDEEVSKIFKWNYLPKVRGVFSYSKGCLLSAEDVTMQRDVVCDDFGDDALVRCTYDPKKEKWTIVRKCIDRKRPHMKEELRCIAKTTETHMSIYELMKVLGLLKKVLK